MGALTGKRALVTGAGRRVGAEIAQALGQAGMRVAVHYHSAADGAEATCAAIRDAGGEAQAFGADLRDPDATAGLAQRVSAAWGGLDLLVASAANFEHTPLAELQAADMQAAFALNCVAPLGLALAFRESLAASGGSIVFVTCISRRSPYREYLAYTVSKAAVYQVMRNLALELAPDVRVNAVAPGTVLVPDSMPEAALQSEISRIPLGRTGAADDVARAVLYLAEAPFVTGTELVVDGGRTL